MVPWKFLIPVLILLNLLFLSFNYYSISNISNKAATKINETGMFEKDEVFQSDGSVKNTSFDNPQIAYEMLSLLDIFSTVNTAKTYEDFAKDPFHGMKVNEDYCKHHREYLVHHPELSFKQVNLVTTFWKNHAIRKGVLAKFKGRDVHPNIFSKMENYNQFAIDLKPQANIFFTSEAMHSHRRVGQHFACLSQIYNHIPGHEKMCRKDLVGNALIEYSKTYKTRPHCFNFNQFFPKTWILTQKNQCKDFFKEFVSPKYQELKKERGVVYFRKIGSEVHKGEGVFPVGDAEEKKILKLYENGTACGRVKDNNLIQYAVHNSLLVNGHKFHFRVYMFVASTNPLIAYYHDGYMRLSVNKFSQDSNDIDTFVTNRGITKLSSNSGRQESPFQGMTEKQIKEATCWFYKQLFDYLFSNNLINDKNWLDNHLRLQFKKAMVHLLRMSQDKFAKISSLSELYGLDFMMDTNLNVWFIEANPMPLIVGWSKRTNKFFNRLLRDNFEIVFGLLRSRMKRITIFINRLMKNPEGWYSSSDGNKIFILDLESRRKEFKEISMNYFEPEFKPSSINTFQKIVDENLSGPGRYMGLLTEECI